MFNLSINVVWHESTVISSMTKPKGSFTRPQTGDSGSGGKLCVYKSLAVVLYSKYNLVIKKPHCRVVEWGGLFAAAF